METPTTDYSKLSTRELYELTAKAEGYESVPVDIDTFLNDPYYLGQTYDNGKGVYEYWRDALHRIYPNPLYSPYEEICVTGCIGAGKTSFAIMGAMYDLYHVCLLREPQRKYKLLRTTRILFSLVTATKDLASAVMANQMLDVIAASPFFTSRFMPKKGEKIWCGHISK